MTPLAQHFLSGFLDLMRDIAAIAAAGIAVIWGLAVWSMRKVLSGYASKAELEECHRRVMERVNANHNRVIDKIEDVQRETGHEFSEVKGLLLQYFSGDRQSNTRREDEK